MSAEVKPGYKMTEVGVIPECWQDIPLGEIVKLQAGYSFKSINFSERGIPVIRISDIQDGVVSADGAVCHQPFNISSDFLIQNGDCLLAMSGATTGKVGVFNGDSCAYQNQRVGRFVVRDKEKISHEFIRHLVSSGFFAGKIRSSLEQGAQPNISGRQVESIVVPVPRSKNEQYTIADVLRNIEAMIRSLDQLVSKKLDIKQAAMQQLLTGQKRLPGFSGEWEVKPMRALGNTYGGLAGKKKNDFGHGKSRYIPFMNVMTDTVIDSSWLEPVDVAPDEVQSLAKKGDLFFNGSSETPEEVGFCSVLLEEIPSLYLNSFCFGFRFNVAANVNGLFFAYWFRSKAGRAAMSVLAQGATRYNIAKSAFMQLEIPQPSEAEQTAIASILSDMDNEIAALEARRDKARQLKQGMMQELLTGRIRLIKEI